MNPFYNSPQNWSHAGQKLSRNKRTEKPVYTIRTQIMGDVEFMAFHCK